MKKRLLTILTAVMIASTGLPVAAPVTVYADEAEEGTEPQEVEPEGEPEVIPEEEPKVEPEEEPKEEPKEEPEEEPKEEPVVNPEEPQQPQEEPKVEPEAESTDQTGEGTTTTQENGENAEATKSTDGLVSNDLPENGIMLLSDGEDEGEETNVQKFIRLAMAIDITGLPDDATELDDDQAETLYQQISDASEAYAVLTDEEKQTGDVKDAYTLYELATQYFTVWRYEDEHGDDPIDADEATLLRKDHLSERDQFFYDLMLTRVKAILAGNETSTAITMDLAEMVDRGEIEQAWMDDLMHMNVVSSHETTNQEGDTDEGTEGTGESGEQQEGGYITSQLENWADHIYDALQYDHPYELYWGSANSEIERDDDKNTITFSMGIAVEYREDEDNAYEFRSGDEGDALRQEAEKANEVVEAIAAEAYDMDAEDAITYYNARVCSLVSYDNKSIGPEAVQGAMRPSNIVNTFDLDPDTNIICAGYSKSMQLLFNYWRAAQEADGEDCKIYMYYTTGSAIEYIDKTPRDDGHAWNTIHSENGNCVVDTTHYDESDGQGTFSAFALLTATDPDQDEIDYHGVTRTKCWWWGTREEPEDVHTFQFNSYGTQQIYTSLDLYNETEQGGPYKEGSILANGSESSDDD